MMSPRSVRDGEDAAIVVELSAAYVREWTARVGHWAAGVERGCQDQGVRSHVSKRAAEQIVDLVAALHQLSERAPLGSPGDGGAS